MQNAIDIKNLIFSWPGSSSPALQVESFSLARAERVFLRGQSGSGKSTLLNRAEHIGYIFQQFNLLPYLNVLDNTTLACRLSASRRQRACEASGSVEEAAYALMDELGLARSLAKQAVTSLSIGQQQRVAAARALIGGPDLIIADEPTSALDTEHRQRFIEQLLATCAERDVALLFVSHDPGLQVYFDRVVDMHDLNRSSQHVLD